jgi:hypothetical protein
MLAVVSAVVAFDRWPGGNVPTRVQTRVLDEKPAPIRVTSTSTAPSATTITSSPRTLTQRAASSAPRVRPNAGGVAGERVGGGTTVPPTPTPPAVPGPGGEALQPVAETTTPIFDAVSNPGTTAGQVAGGVQLATGQVGASVGQLSPQVGEVVAATGQVVAQTVQQLPLPQHLLPGH